MVFNVLYSVCEGVTVLGSYRQLFSSNIRIKYGIDPTAAKLHLGHLMCLLVLRVLLRVCVYSVVFFVIGDYTTCLRNTNKRRDIVNNISSLISVTRIFFACYNLRCVFIRNSSWLSYIAFDSIYRVASRVLLLRRTVRILSLSLGELLYPIYQSYDSVFLQPHIEVGGFDQLSNFVFYRRCFSYSVVFVLVPLLLGFDGVLKMSKSFTNAVSFNLCAFDMFLLIFRLPEFYFINYFFVFGRLFVLSSRLVKFLLACGVFYRFSMFLFVSRWVFPISVTYGVLRLYFSGLIFQFRSFTFRIFSSLYLFTLLLAYGIFISKRSFKTAVLNGSVSINGIKLSYLYFVLLDTMYYEVIIGDCFRLYICY